MVDCLELGDLVVPEVVADDGELVVEAVLVVEEDDLVEGVELVVVVAHQDEDVRVEVLEQPQRGLHLFRHLFGYIHLLLVEGIAPGGEVHVGLELVLLLVVLHQRLLLVVLALLQQRALARLPPLRHVVLRYRELDLRHQQVD